MSKNNKGKVIQMLSPENYIQKKVRTLPIYECLVRSDWEETKLPTVTIARNHTNGNITVCSYLVDLLCLGVKDSMYLFNVPVHKYEEFKEKVNGEMEMKKVDYTLAHNIVYAGIEFAEEYGFKPHKDYESVTKYMLEEDTEDIELIEIDCGNDGKPLYMRGPFEDDAKARKIIAQLEKNAGPGKYDYVDVSDGWDDDDFGDDFDDDDEFDDDEFDEDVNEFSEMAFEEKRELFLDMFSKISNLDEDEGKRFVNLVNSLVDDVVDVNRHNKFYDEFLEELNIEVDEAEIPDQLLGVRSGDQAISEELKDRFIDLCILIEESPKLGNEELKLFQKEAKGIPGVYFLELLLLQSEDSSKYTKRLEKYFAIYPEYSMIKILWATAQVVSQKKPQIIPGYPFKLKSFFPDRETIHPMELFYTLMLYAFMTGLEMDIDKIEAFGSVLWEFDLPEYQEEVLSTTVSMFKISYLQTYIKN